jgi:serine/threonine-protein kinase
MTPAPSLEKTVLAGRFQIERALASGAAGVVYEATHLTLGSRVAVKVLRDNGVKDADARRRRFLREARLAAGIQSEHVVRVYDFGAQEDGPAYLVMELLRGETLAERLRCDGRLPIAEAVDLIIQAATPLAVLHENGIIHRDVKPSNLFLARDFDGSERLKLLDFGVAAFQRPVSSDEATISGGRYMIGTPRYMAPEQVRGSPDVDARADVWALGVTLYELLAGRPPFDAQSVLTVLRQIQKKLPAPLRARRPEVPTRLAAFVHLCLEKDASRRPANARAVVDALVPLRSSLREPEPAWAVGEAVNLSIHDPDVEILYPARRVRRIWQSVIAAAGLSAALVAVLALSHRPGNAPADPVAGSSELVPRVVDTAPATTNAETTALVAPPAPAPTTATPTSRPASAVAPSQATAPAGESAPPARTAHPPPRARPPASPRPARERVPLE